MFRTVARGWALGRVVKMLVKMPTPPIGMPDLHSNFLLIQILGGSADSFLPPRRESGIEFQDPGPNPGPALAFAGVWTLNQGMRALSVS